MAIPDVPSGDDKTLSDISDDVRQTLKLPDELRMEAQTGSPSTIAPKSDLLPRITLSEPTDLGLSSATTPPLGIRLDGTVQPIKTVEATAVTSAAHTNSLTITESTTGIKPDSSDAQPITIRTTNSVVSDTALPVHQPDNSIPISVVKANFVPNSVVTSASGLRVDSGTTQIIASKPQEVAAATPPPVAPPMVTPAGGPLPTRTADAAFGSTAISGFRADSGTQGTKLPQEVAAATPPPVAPPMVTPAGGPLPTRTADAAFGSTAISGFRADSGTQGTKLPQEVAAATPPPVAPPMVTPAGGPLPTRTADAAFGSTAISGFRADSGTQGTKLPQEVAAATPPPVAPPMVTPAGGPLPTRTADAAFGSTAISGFRADSGTQGTKLPQEVAAATPPPVAPPMVTPAGGPLPTRTADAAFGSTAISGFRADSGTQGTKLPQEVAAATPPPVAPPMVTPAGGPLPTRTADAAFGSTTISGFRADSGTQGTKLPQEVAAVAPPPVAPPMVTPAGGPLPTRTADAAFGSTTASGFRADSGITQITSPPPLVAVATPTLPPTITAQADSSTPGKVLDKLASAATQPQQVGYAVGSAAPKTETSETSGTTPTSRIHTSSQFAVTREATQNITAGMQSYAAATASQDSKTQHASSTEKEARTAALQPGALPPGALPPGAQPGIPGTKEVSGPPRSSDPQSLLTAMENAASRKVIGSVGPGEIAPPQGKPTTPLPGAQTADASTIKQQDAAGNPIVRTDVHGRILPPTATTDGVHTTQIASASNTAGAMPPLEGRVAQNVMQPGQHGIAPDSKSGAADTHKEHGVNPTTPGAIGQSVSTGKEHDDTKRILDVPNLNLDDKTQHTGEKGKTHVADQSNTDGTTNTQTKAETELANLFDRAKKDKKEQPQEADNIDTAAAAQQWVNTKRLEHKLRKGETLDLVSRKYFGDDIASTLIVELNPLVLNPRMHEHRVIISLPANSIIVIPFPNEVERFKKQLVAGTRTRMNIVYE